MGLLLPISTIWLYGLPMYPYSSNFCQKIDDNTVIYGSEMLHAYFYACGLTMYVRYVIIGIIMKCIFLQFYLFHDTQITIVIM